MKKILFLCLLAVSCKNPEAGNETTKPDDYFEKIRDNSAELTAFFAEMPKGGDLHHHYSGSVYAEKYIDYVLAQNCWINLRTFRVVSQKPVKQITEWAQFSSLSKDSLAFYKQQLFQKWSVKDYNHVSYPSDKLFFESFGCFGLAVWPTVDSGLVEIKKRAVAEHVNYIETMFTSIPTDIVVDSKPFDTSSFAGFSQSLIRIGKTQDKKRAVSCLDSLYKLVMNRNAPGYADFFNADITQRHNKLKLDDSTFTIRYMNYVTRSGNPADVFKAMVLCFESATKSPLIVGVNIVSPEDGEVSMRDYWLHMQMFGYCHEKYPGVKISMHAGELTLGLVKPEELTSHINGAVYEGKANRIGHGVDMAYEKKAYDLLNYMRENKVAIEINLVSNEFILKVKDDQHPFMLYKDFNVPIVISTDDAGILRSNLTDQYVLLAKRYKSVTYSDIKTYVFNSIDYSFIKEPEVKARLRAQLTKQFSAFEEKIAQVSADLAAKE